MFDLPFVGEAKAGEIAGYRDLAKPNHFYDWDYAKEVWAEKLTSDALNAEYDKYASDFDPWLEVYKKSPRKARKLLENYPEAKRKRIQRGHDVQLAYDQWVDRFYMQWWKYYEGDVFFEKAKDFEYYLDIRRSKPCDQKVNIFECGGPDWRNAGWLKAEAKMKSEAQAKYAKAKKRQDAIRAARSK